MRKRLQMKSFVGALVDQACAAIASLLILITVAKIGSVQEFGTIAGLQLLISLVVQGFRQSVGGSALRDGQDAQFSGAVTAIAAILLSILWFLALVSVLVGAFGGVLALGFSVAAAGAMVQERGRLSLQARRKNLVSGGMSLVSLIVITLACGLLYRFSNLEWSPWLTAGAIQTTVWLPVLALAHDFSGMSRLRRAIEVSGREWRETGEAFIFQAFTWAAPVAILGAFVGAGAVGGLRGSQTIAAVGQQAPQAMFPYFLARGLSRRGMLLWILMQFCVFSLLAGVLAMHGSEVGDLLLGDTWPTARPIMVPILLAAFIASVSLGLEIHLRLVGRTDTIVRARRFWAVTQMLTVTLATAEWGLLGAAWAMALGPLLVFMTLLGGVLRRPSAS